ncbi:MAG: carbon-nitrogen hydrolase family protein [Candidatus Omnitrophica bacterium]|nr:carbon-nitrogen hydrolase family protein [Candidatus Omnitrophota bacterium]
MKIALVQMNAGKDKAKNIAKAVSFVTKAVRQRAEFVLLPEVFHYRGKTGKRHILNNVAEKIPGQSLEPLMQIAREHKIYILAGSVYEKDSSSKALYNTSVFIDRRGKIIARYRKNNLFKARIGNKKINEANYMTPGKRKTFVAADTLKVGMSICYDLRFPGMYQFYLKKGCHVLAVPAAFTQKTGETHWEPLLRARAIENQCYVLAPNQAGQGGRGIWAYGHSMVIDPWGNILVKASARKEQVVYCQIFKENVMKARRRLPMNRLNER